MINIPDDLKIRKYYLDTCITYIGKDIIKVIVGQRRTGKSYLLYQIIDYIRRYNPSANIVSINKELYEFNTIRTDNDLIAYVSAHEKEENNYLFIDEIQEIENFEIALRSLFAEKKWDIWCTGSNASLLSSDIAGKLSGRYIEIPVYPLNFEEFLDFHGLGISIELYYRFGGSPYLIHLPLKDEIVFQYLRGIYSTILFKDIVVRHKIRNVHFLEQLVLFIASNTGYIITAKKISDYLKSQRINVPPNLILEYLQYLTDAFMLHKIRRADIQGKKIFEIGEKYYFNDIGLRNALWGFRINDINQILENVVLNHLLSHGYNVLCGYSGEREIDFICEKNNERSYIQVCYVLKDEKTIEREFGNLLQIKDNYPKYVVSTDSIESSSYKGIKHLNIEKFLLSFK